MRYEMGGHHFDDVVWWFEESVSVAVEASWVLTDASTNFYWSDCVTNALLCWRSANQNWAAPFWFTLYLRLILPIHTPNTTPTAAIINPYWIVCSWRSFIHSWRSFIRSWRSFILSWRSTRKISEHSKCRSLKNLLTTIASEFCAIRFDERTTASINKLTTF